MFVRRKNNKSGIVSVQVIAKVNGKSKLVKTIGSSGNLSIIDDLVKEGNNYIATFAGQQIVGFSDQSTTVKSVFRSIHSHTEVGTELLLGKIFNDIGFNAIDDIIFKHLVLSRLTYPVSKLKNKRFFG